MRIAQVSPLTESVPPKTYGGTERVVSWLTDELVRQGHDVTLFASGDSITDAELVPCCRQALRLDPNCQDPYPHLMMMLDTVRTCAHEFDIVHFHMDFFQFPLFRQMANRTLTTLHGRQDIPDYVPLYRNYHQMPLAAISKSQAGANRYGNVTGIIYHGLPVDLLKPIYKPRGDYVAFLGRITRDKRPDLAIKIARAAGVPLKIAAKVDVVDKTYFHETIEPMLDGPGVEFIGEIGERQKQDFIGNARAVLFPIDWPEPFGLVMIEALACGTPVLAFKNGSVPEVLDDGLTGRIVENVEEAIRALPDVMALNRRAIRRTFEERFSVTRMANDYVRLYRKILNKPVHDSRKTNGAGLIPELQPSYGPNR